MTSEASTPWDAILLRDGEGNLYEIPFAIIQRYRVADDRRSELERAVGDDVAGFRAPVSARGLYVWSEEQRRWLPVREATDADMGTRG